jgi:hypothetical protein
LVTEHGALSQGNFPSKFFSAVSKNEKLNLNYSLHLKEKIFFLAVLGTDLGLMLAKAVLPAPNPSPFLLFR